MRFWFAGLSMNPPGWEVTVFTRKRDRLFQSEVADQLLAAVLAHARRRGTPHIDRMFAVYASCFSLARRPKLPVAG